MIDFEAVRPLPRLDSIVVFVDNPAFDEPVAAVDEHLSRLGSNHFVSMAEHAESHEGMQYSVVGGGKDRSLDTAILMPGTFANGVWPHIVARAEAISFMAAEAGLRDNSGNIVPVIMTGSPSMRSRYGLSYTERQSVSDGNFDPIARRHKALLGSVGYQAIHGIFNSQSALLAEPIANSLRNSFVVGNAVVAEPPLRRLGVLQENKGLKQALQDENIAVINELFATKQATDRFERGVLRELPENLACVRGMGRAAYRFAQDLSDVNRLAPKVTFIHGIDSKVTPYHEAEAIYEHARILSNRLSGLGRVVVAGANHSLGDRVGRWSTLVAANLAA